MKKALWISFSFFIFFCNPIDAKEKISSNLARSSFNTRNIDPRIKVQLEETLSQNEEFSSKSGLFKKSSKGELTNRKFAEKEEIGQNENSSEVRSKDHSIRSNQVGGSKNTPSVQVQTPTLVAPNQIQSVTIQNPITTHSNSSVTQKSTSPSEGLYDLRKKTEKQTRERIIENLEMFRINQERKRQQKIMNKLYELEHGVKIREESGGKTQTKEKNQKSQKSLENREKRLDSNRTLKNNNSSREWDWSFLKRSFLSATFGLSNYMDAKNINQSYGGGFGFGYQFKNNFSLESSFLYTKHKILQYYEYFEAYYKLDQKTNYVDLSEYGFSFQAHYHLRNQTIFTPYFGASLLFKQRNYTRLDVSYEDHSSHNNRRRNHDDDDDDDYYDDDEWLEQKNGTAKTRALDVNGIVGLEVRVLPRVSFGLDYQYKINVFNTNEQKTTYSHSGEKFQSIEEMSNWFLGLKLKVLLD